MVWSVANYNTNPALNTSINGIDIDEGCDADGFNNALRQVLADIAVWTATYAVSYPISIANGGTGQGDAVNALAALGGLSVAYKELAQSAKSSGYTFDLTQSAGHVYYTGGAATATLPANATVAFPVGSVITIINNGSGALAISRAGGVTMKWSVGGVDANRSLAVGGVCSLIKVATDVWFISGAGLS